MVILKEINEFNDLKQVMKNSEPDTFYNLKIDLGSGDKLDERRLKLLDYLADNFNLFKGKVKFVNLYVPYEKISKKDFKHLFKFYKKTSNNIPSYVNVSHKYMDDEDFFEEIQSISWDLKTIIKANLEIDDVCKFIKSNRLSPFEALAYVHNYVSTVANYNPSNNLKSSDWYAKDQYFAGAYIDLPEVICAGYSSLMKEIIDTLDMPELKCDIIGVELTDKKSNYHAKHARCLIKVKDDKYGLNQTVFDDPTWDNNKDAECSQYANFAMKNNCHEPEISKSYNYYIPYIYQFINNKSGKIKLDLNTYKTLFNKSQNQIDQKMVETCYVNIMHKRYKEASTNEIYYSLKKMASASFKQQEKRNFVGNLTQAYPILTRKEISKICCESIKTEDREKTLKL